MVNIGNAFALKEIWNGIRGFIPHGSKEAPLEQQMASGLIPSYDDEAISAALDAALVHEKGSEYLDHIKAVRAELQPHQRDRWRKVYGNIKLTERHENALSSKKSTKVETSAKGPGREDSTEEYQRRQRDYEYTPEDPRLQHLVLVSEMARDQGVDMAIKYLITSDFALEKSLTQQATEKFESLKKSGGEKLTRGAYSLFLGDEYDQICEQNQGKPMEELEKILSAALVAKTARDQRELVHAKKNRLLHAKPVVLFFVIALTATMIVGIGLIQFLK